MKIRTLINILVKHFNKIWLQTFGVEIFVVYKLSLNSWENCDFGSFSGVGRGSIMLSMYLLSFFENRLSTSFFAKISFQILFGDGFRGFLVKKKHDQTNLSKQTSRSHLILRLKSRLISLYHLVTLQLLLKWNIFQAIFQSWTKSWQYFDFGCKSWLYLYLGTTKVTQYFYMKQNLHNFFIIYRMWSKVSFKHYFSNIFQIYEHTFFTF